MAYARRTQVPAQQSRYEIECCLSRAGATCFAFATDTSKAMVGFTLDTRDIRIEIVLPPLSDFARDRHGYVRSTSAQSTAHDQEVRRLWRCLLLSIKAKLTAIEEGISTVDREFMPDLVLSDGRRLEVAVRPELLDSRLIGRRPMLIGFGSLNSSGEA